MNDLEGTIAQRQGERWMETHIIILSILIFLQGIVVYIAVIVPRSKTEEAMHSTRFIYYWLCKQACDESLCVYCLRPGIRLIRFRKGPAGNRVDSGVRFLC